MTYAIVDQPGHGTASVVAGQLHYVPDTDYTGDDAFTYQASDGYLDSNTATVDVTVTAPITNFGLQFDGTNDYVTFGAATAELGVQTFTLEAWVKRAAGGATMTTGTDGLDGTSGRPRLPSPDQGHGRRRGAGQHQHELLPRDHGHGLCRGRFRGQLGGGNHPAWGTSLVPIGEWHHIAATYGGGCWNLYLDGIQETLNAAVTACPNATPENLSIQRAALATGLDSTTGTSGGYFSGVIDEARVWSYARSATEISATFDVEATGTETGLLGRWSLDDGDGTTAANSVSGSPAGTLVNGPVWVAGFAP